ncbi:hypothetical protein KFL_000060010 [Klebsormidium nitens]|uniref:Cysteine-rich transmembrane domain-containing protein n=1 Tax=Klebsormidium nitens TaxID=105231 RepID=A0A0U9HKF3_KLENI|nr:hypothetical protein KFL_000060010 [Klebsormidium nitens]|eukprot:GAQ77936.1 hypothetical protein KFL_000060010 [Klebsormidium nitens]
MRRVKEKAKSSDEESSAEEEGAGNEAEEDFSRNRKKKRDTPEGPSEKGNRLKKNPISNGAKRVSKVMEKLLPTNKQKEKECDEGTADRGSNEGTKKDSEGKGETSRGEGNTEGSEGDPEGTSPQSGQNAEPGHILPQCQQSGQPNERPAAACFLPGYVSLPQNVPPNQCGNFFGGNGNAPLQQIAQPNQGGGLPRGTGLDAPAVHHVVKKLPKLTQAERGRDFWKSCLAAMCVCCTLEACGGGVRKNEESDD